MTHPRCLLALTLALLAVTPAALAEDVGPGAGPGGLPVANNAFAWKLYDHVRAGEDNLFFSPYSISAALWMTYEGAAGKTAREMDRVLHLEGESPGGGYRGLVQALRPNEIRDGFGRDARMVPAYQMRIANALWGQKGFAFQAPFTRRLDDVYRAPLARIDFGDPPAARRIINDWVARQTRDKIKNIVPEGLPPPLTRLVLANAIYFKAQWAQTFSERATKEADFTTSSGVVRAQLMHKIGNYPYAESDRLQVLELPYRGGTTSMVVLLPKAKGGLAAIEKAVCEGSLGSWMKGLESSARVDVKLPRFEFTRSLDLESTLERMGMPSAFSSSNADFSRMTSAEKLYIGAVLHKAFVAVDENGTEAAAATVVMMKGRSMPTGKPVRFWADHPFLFLIRHRPTGTILFMGRVTNPKVG